MATAIKMPQLGMTMTEATVVRWVKAEGDEVHKGEVVAEIETDKLNADVDAPTDGVLRRILAQPGEVVPVVGLLAVIGASDEPDSAIDAVAGQQDSAVVANSEETTPTPPPVAPEQRPVSGSSGEMRASPLAKRLAADLGVDMATVRGSGPGGRIVEADVRAASEPHAQPAAPELMRERPVDEEGFVRASPIARRLAREAGLELHAIAGTGPEGRVLERDVTAAVEHRAATPAPTIQPATSAVQPTVAESRRIRERIPLTGMRKTIADRMHRSLQQAAQLTIGTEADATALVRARQELVADAKVQGDESGPTYTDLLVKIVARALREHPYVNATIAEAEILLLDDVHVGVAVALDSGLIVPNIKEADRLSLTDIARESRRLVAAARDGKLKHGEVSGATFTITNLGMFDVDFFTPILNPPESAILGVGRIVKKLMPDGDATVVRSMMALSLTFDHRAFDGAPAARFLQRIKRLVEHPLLAL